MKKKIRKIIDYKFISINTYDYNKFILKFGKDKHVIEFDITGYNNTYDEITIGSIVDNIIVRWDNSIHFHKIIHDNDLDVDEYETLHIVFSENNICFDFYCIFSDIEILEHYEFGEDDMRDAIMFGFEYSNKIMSIEDPRKRPTPVDLYELFLNKNN